MPLDEPHPIWPEGPDCDEQCPGKWSQYHDGFAWGYEKAVAAERARIAVAVERMRWAPDSDEDDETEWIDRAAVLAIVNPEPRYIPAGLTLPGKSREDYIEEANEAIRILMAEREEFRNTLDEERLARALADRRTWTCPEDCGDSQWGYCRHEITLLAKAYREDTDATD